MIVKLGTETIRTIALFERITKVQPKDCLITDNCVYFLVDSEKIGLAIGRNGSVVKEVRRLLGKMVKIFGFSNNPQILIRNLVPNIKNIDMNNGTMMITIPNEDKLLVIGKNGSNIKALNELMSRHCSIKRVRLR